jgi:ferredoxin-NADP reductase
MENKIILDSGKKENDISKLQVPGENKSFELNAEKQYTVRVKSIDKITHDVFRIVTEKPDGYSFTPGQATEISINKEGWRGQKRPFTFTCLPDDEYLEFTIKTYPEKKGVTNELLKLEKNDELILHDVFGAIHYNGEGIFIAGGAGVTPFIAIFRYLNSRHEIGNNKLIFANKTKADIINEEEFRILLGDNFINVLSDEDIHGYIHGFINQNIIETNVGKKNAMFYLCGPPLMMDAIEKIFENMHVPLKSIIKEEF